MSASPPHPSGRSGVMVGEYHLFLGSCSLAGRRAMSGPLICSLTEHLASHEPELLVAVCALLQLCWV